MPISHRPGSLRQENKKHKGTGNHQSKRSTKLASGAGRVESVSSGPKAETKRAIDARKSNRANHVTQMRKKKREEVWLQKRLGSDHGPPKVCMWVCLSPAADPAAIQKDLLESCSSRSESSTGMGMVTASFNLFKQRSTFLTPDRNLSSVLEFAKVADVLLLVLPVHQGPDHAVDEVGDSLITALKAAGLPAVVGVVQGLEKLKGKKQADMRKWGQRFFDTEFAGQAKAVDASNTNLLGRTLGTTPVRRVHWRSSRSYILAESVKVVTLDDSNGAEQHGTLHVRGYIRGRPLDVNQMVHICDAGHFRMRQINSAKEPLPVKPKRRFRVEKEQSTTQGTVEEVMAMANFDEQEDLSPEAEVDGLAGEQTWPTERELAAAALGSAGGSAEIDEMMYQEAIDGDHSQDRVAKTSSQGWSAYQAEWLAETSSLEGEGDSDVGDTWTVEREGNANDEEGFGDLRDTSLDLAKRRNAEDEDTRFPDEVDTPSDRAARERFARFRALKSFRTSPWDSKESLPADYARIFQFEDFAAMQKDIMSAGEAKERQQNEQLISSKAGSSSRSSRRPSFASSEMDVEEGSSSSRSPHVEQTREVSAIDGHEGHVASGLYVEVLIDRVPLNLLDTRKELLGGEDWPLLLFSLLKHEHRLSVLNFNIHRDPRYVEPIPSKEPLIFQCGFRRWTGKPIFSQANLNCDKHKYERFLRTDCFSAASVYGPTTFQPCPVLVFKETGETIRGGKRTVLVATGTLLGVNPDRIVLKKIVLTGYPIRVRKRKAVVKHMFHCPEDIKWFKPAEMVTKYGLTGHIKEPIGTHGLMKVIFNKAVKQNDTVCLSLYKRVYPKMVGGEVVVR